MKKLFVIILTFSIIVTIAIIPINAALIPTTDGSYNVPGSTTSGSTGITTDFNMHYAYCNMYYFEGSTSSYIMIQSDGTNYSRYAVAPVLLAPYISTYFPQIGGDTIYAPGYYYQGVMNYVGSSFSSTMSHQFPPTSTAIPNWFVVNEHTTDYINMRITTQSRAVYSGSGITTGERIYYDTGGVEYDVNGFAFQPSSTGAYSITVQGKLVYGNSTGFIYETNIDDSFSQRSAVKFTFDPETLMRAEDTINYDWYYFIGDWFVELPSAIVSYFYVSYDISRENFYSYTNGIEYGEYGYSLDTNPVTRITQNLASISTVDPPTDTLTVRLYENGTYGYDVSDYGHIEIMVDVPTDPVIPPDTPSGDIIQITENGQYNVTDYSYAQVNVPQEVTEFPSLFGWVGNVLNGVLNFELMPNFSLGGIVILLVGIVIIAWLLKVFLGG